MKVCFGLGKRSFKRSGSRRSLPFLPIAQTVCHVAEKNRGDSRLGRWRGEPQVLGRLVSGCCKEFLWQCSRRESRLLALLEKFFSGRITSGDTSLAAHLDGFL